LRIRDPGFSAFLTSRDPDGKKSVSGIRDEHPR
jgi:hypothetical protein